MFGPGASEMPRLALLLLAIGAWVLFGACVTSPDAKPDDKGSIYDLELPKVGGGSLSLEKCRNKVMMLDFFTTWSQPSMLAITSYSVLHKKYAEQGLCLVGIGMDDIGEQVLTPYVRGLDVPYPVLVANAQLKEGKSVFGDLSAIPILMIFDTQGRLAQVFIGLVPTEKIDTVLRRLLP